MKYANAVDVNRRKRSIGRQCMHCGRPATVTATRVIGNGMRLDVRWCAQHADELLEEAK